MRVTPNRLGRYDVVCAELCGIGHSTMRQAVRVVPPGEYTTWATQAKKKREDRGRRDPHRAREPREAAQAMRYLPDVVTEVQR